MDLHERRNSNSSVSTTCTSSPPSSGLASPFTPHLLGRYTDDGVNSEDDYVLVGQDASNSPYFRAHSSPFAFSCRGDDAPRVDHPNFDIHSCSPHRPLRRSLIDDSKLGHFPVLTARKTASRFSFTFRAAIVGVAFLTLQLINHQRERVHKASLERMFPASWRSRLVRPQIFPGYSAQREHEWWEPSKVFDEEGSPWPETGGNGSLIRTEKRDLFWYRNDFGGTWDSRKDSLEARCQSDTPPLSERWNYSSQTISGVNVGGWLALEPFITPFIFEPYLDHPQGVEDEYLLSVLLGDKLEEVLTNHYETFITEKDFAEIAGAGLNWVRLPLPFWAIETREGEPFLAKVAWKYFLKAIEWCRKYGLRLNLDLHSVPGSANGWNHSGKLGTVGLMNGVMGLANAERSLNIIRILSRFIALPVNREVVCMFSVFNEPNVEVMGRPGLRTLYQKIYDVVREETGFGDSNGPVIVIHDGFGGTAKWHGFMKGADRVAMDSHRYIAFRAPNQDPWEQQALKPCEFWMRHFNRTMRGFGISMVAEWSIAVNDCGRFVNGLGSGTRFEGTLDNDPDHFEPAGKPGDCRHWEDVSQWSDEMKAGLQDVALAHMDAFQNWFFWTWKTGPSIRHPTPPANPVWSYSNGLKYGYIPRNPRRSKGFCVAQFHRLNKTAEKLVRYSGKLEDWMVGLGAAPGVALERREEDQWPLETIGSGVDGGEVLQVKDLPRWRMTGSQSPLKIPHGTADTTASLEEDSKVWYEPIPNCEYLDPWQGVGRDVRRSSFGGFGKCQP